METVDFEHTQKRAFLAALAEVPQEYAAARVAKVPIALVKGWYDSDPDFNLACTEVKEHLLDTIEAKAFSLALDGSEQMIKFVLERQREAFLPPNLAEREDNAPIHHRIRDFSGSWVGEEDPIDIAEGEFTEIAEDSGQETST